MTISDNKSGTDRDPRAGAVRAAIHDRRSVHKLAEPAPDDDTLRELVAAAVAAPDHGRLAPWRFLALRASAYPWFSSVLVESLLDRCKAEGREPTKAELEKERTKLHRAPLVVVVAACRQETRIPFVEQISAVAAATQNLLLAASAAGFGTMWRTGPAAYDDRVKLALGLKTDDSIVGFISIGTVPDATATSVPRRCDVGEVLEIVTGAR